MSNTPPKAGFVFELSWEVCNMVGGIHTVLVTKAGEMAKAYGDNYILIGPNVPHPIIDMPAFRDEVWSEPFLHSLQELSNIGILVRMGRWLIPGEPKCLLISSRRMVEHKDKILAQYWEKYQLNSLFGAWDYVEPVLFSHAGSLVIEKLFSNHLLPNAIPTVVQAHEWMTGLALLSLKEHAPEIGTVFTTHATMLGRAVSSQSTDRILSDKLQGQDTELLAQQIDVASKHSLEGLCAKHSDVFTTVSQITSDECVAVHGRRPDILLLNAIGDEVPSPKLIEPEYKRRAKDRLLQIASEVTGCHYDRDRTITLITSGRYEYVNKGVDVYVHALSALQQRQNEIDGGSSGDARGDVRVVAFVSCPRDHGRYLGRTAGPRICTHELPHEQNDSVIRDAQALGLVNDPNSRVHLVFIPIYLDGEDPSLPDLYYELSTGADLSCFPSWYEPWGYTPLEAVALGVPTITTDQAGFGLWAQALGDWNKTGVKVLDRTKYRFPETVTQLADEILKYTQLSTEARKALSDAAIRTSNHARWKAFIENYIQAHNRAIDKAQARSQAPGFDRFRSFSGGHMEMPTETSNARAHIRHFSVKSRSHETLKQHLRISDTNIWWTWHPKTIQLFSLWVPSLWEQTKGDPIQFIERVDDAMLSKLTTDPELKLLLTDLQDEFSKISQRAQAPQIAYFCMEYGLFDPLRIYSGGLGILAGDYLKVAADTQTPIVAFGLFFRLGYFRQRISNDGQQEALFHRVDLKNLPLKAFRDEDGHARIFEIPCEGKSLYFRVWKLCLGGVNLYLLDTDVAANPPEWRLVSDRLYPSDPERRVLQEWVLSLGGLELIKELNIEPHVYHMNEGHTAFVIIGRTIELMKKYKLSYEEALMYVRHSTIFTTHTPVPAGHDQFPEHIVAKVLVPYLKKNDFDDTLISKTFALGKSLDMGPSNLFSMTGLALRGSHFVNGVSRIHGYVSQKMFSAVFPELKTSEVPVTSVTNGVHLRTWVAPDWQNLFFQEMGDDWYNQVRNEHYWDKFRYLPDDKVWQVKKQLKGQLVDWIGNYIRRVLQDGQTFRPELAAVLGSLTENTLIITHAKRMTPYKRAELLFSNQERLKKIVNGNQSVLFIYAGKSHPSDGMGRDLIHRINSFARSPDFIGKILFIDNYDLTFARTLIAGSDIWINTPLRPLEACGTSGMKAGINGTINLAVADGWWPEYYNEKNGWLIGNPSDTYHDEMQNLLDANSVYHLLESEVIPSFAQRDSAGIPRSWVARLKESIASLIPQVSGERMIEDYQKILYNPAIKYARGLKGDGSFVPLKKHLDSRDSVQANWAQVSFTDIQIKGHKPGQFLIGDSLEIEVSLSHKGLPFHLLDVQAILNPASRDDYGRRESLNYPLTPDKGNTDGNSIWKGSIVLSALGDHTLGVRVQPKGAESIRSIDMTTNLTKWL